MSHSKILVMLNKNNKFVKPIFNKNTILSPFVMLVLRTRSCVKHKHACYCFYAVKTKEAQDYHPKKGRVVCAFWLRIGDHGHPKGDNQGQSPCMQGHLKSSILTAYAQPSCAYCWRSLDGFPKGNHGNPKGYNHALRC